MTVVGTATYVVTADTSALEKEVGEADFSSLEAKGATAGEDTGKAMRAGVAGETAGLTTDLEAAGSQGGAALSAGIGKGAKDAESGLSDVKSASKDAATVAEDSSGSFGKLGGALESTAEHGGGLSSMLGALPGPVGMVSAAVVGAGAVFLDLGMKMQDATDKIAAAEGISTSAAAGIGDAFSKMSYGSTFTGTQVAEAFAGVAAQAQQLEGHALTASESVELMKPAMDLAEAGGVNLNSATKDLTATLQQFGLGISQSPLVTNVLYNAGKQTGLGVDGVTAALSKARSAAGDAAPPLQSLAAMLVDLQNNGEKGKQGMSALTIAMTSLTKPTLETAAAQNAAGGSFLNAQGKLIPFNQILGESAKAIQGQNDTQAKATLTSLGWGANTAKVLDMVRSGPEAYNMYAAGVTKVGSAQDAASKTTSGLSGTWDKVKASVETAAQQLGTKMIPTLTSLGKEVTKVIEYVVAHWPEISAAIKTAVAVVKPIVEGMIDQFKGFIKVIQGVIDFVKGVFTGHWSEAWDGIKEIFGGILQSISGVLDVFGKKILDILHKAWSDVANDIHEMWSTIINWITGNVINPIVNFFTSIPGKIAHVWSDVVNAIHTAWNVIAGWVNDNVVKPVVKYYEAIGTGIAHVWTDVVNAIHTAWTVISTWVNTNVVQPVIKYYETIITGVAHVWSDIVNAIHTAWIVIADWVNNNVIKPVVQFFETLPGKIAHVWTDVWNAYTEVWSKIADWVNNNVVKPVIKFYESLPGLIAHVWSDIVTAIETAWNIISGWVNTNVVQPVVKFFESIPGAVAHVWSDIVNAVEWGWAVISGWVTDNVINPVIKTFESIPTAIKHIWSDIVNDATTGVSGIISVINGITSGINTVLSFLHIGTIPPIPTGPAISLSSAGQFHSGGVIDGAGAAPSGMSPNERLIQVLVGEEVLTENDPRHSRNLGGGFVNNSGSFDIGGIVGDVTGFVGGLAKDVVQNLSGVIGMFATPAIDAAESAANALAGPLGEFGQMLAGEVHYLGEAAKSWLKTMGDAASAKTKASSGGGAVVVGSQATGAMADMFSQILQGIGAPVNATTLADLSAWQQAEGGWYNGDNYNPFNTTQQAGGSHGTNSVGVQSYPTFGAGLAATVSTINQGNMGAIKAALVSSAGLGAFEAAVDGSPWGTVFDQGGILPPGATLAINNTGRNEYVNTAGSGGGQVFQFNVNAGAVVINVPGGTTANAAEMQQIVTAAFQQLGTNLQSGFNPLSRMAGR